MHHINSQEVKLGWMKNQMRKQTAGTVALEFPISPRQKLLLHTFCVNYGARRIMVMYRNCINMSTLNTNSQLSSRLELFLCFLRITKQSCHLQVQKSCRRLDVDVDEHLYGFKRVHILWSFGCSSKRNKSSFGDAVRYFCDSIALSNRFKYADRGREGG